MSRNGRSPRVLICDDQRKNYGKLRAYLQKEGFDVHKRVWNEAQIRHALSEAESSRKWFHFVMLDINLDPDGPTGIDIFKNLSIDHPHEEYIIYSSSDIDTFRDEINRLLYRDIALVLLDDLIKRENIQLHLASLVQRCDPRRVFLVHGRDTPKNSMMQTLLTKHFGLTVISWEQAREASIEQSRSARPSIFDIVIQGIEMSHATIVLFTDDEKVQLRKSLQNPDDPDSMWKSGSRRQSRANVYIEAGYAMGKRPKRTLFVEWTAATKEHILPSDFSGIHTVRFVDDEDGRSQIKRRLEAARCLLKPHRQWRSLGLG